MARKSDRRTTWTSRCAAVNMDIGALSTGVGEANIPIIAAQENQPGEPGLRLVRLLTSFGFAITPLEVPTPGGYGHLAWGILRHDSDHAVQDVVSAIDPDDGDAAWTFRDHLSIYWRDTAIAGTGGVQPMALVDSYWAGGRATQGGAHTVSMARHLVCDYQMRGGRGTNVQDEVQLSYIFSFCGTAIGGSEEFLGNDWRITCTIHELALYITP